MNRPAETRFGNHQPTPIDTTSLFPQFTTCVGVWVVHHGRLVGFVFPLVVAGRGCTAATVHPLGQPVRHVRAPTAAGGDRVTVYVIGSQAGRLVKVGWSRDPTRRLRDLQVGSPVELSLLWTGAPELPQEIETSLHSLFSAYWHHGEWFDFGAADPVALISAAVHLPLMQVPERTVARERRNVRSRLALVAPADPEPEITLLKDVCHVMASASVMHLVDIVNGLVGLRPKFYRGLSPRDLGGQLRRAGIPVATVYVADKPRRESANKGIKRVDLLAVAA